MIAAGTRVSVRRRRTARRAMIALLAGCAVLLGACTGSSTTIGKAGSPRRPNIVFVLTDDLSTNLLPYMPHVAAMINQGTSFSHYYVVDSLCCPSRSAIFTGRFPHDDHVYTNHPPDGGYAAFDASDQRATYGSALQRAGYRTAMMGKYLNGYQPNDPIPRGWDEWDVTGDGYPEYNYTLNQDGLQVQYGHEPDDYLTDVLSAHAAAFIDSASQGRKPFALEVATFAPHRPATPAPRDIGTFPTLRAPEDPAWNTTPTDPPSWLAHFPPLTAHNIARINLVYRKRVEAVQAVDDLVGHLETQLRADHELHNTYFVFSSDNGYHEGDYRLLPGKETAFDTDIRVPLVVTGPGVPHGRTVNAMTSSIDLAPTFEQLAHAAPQGQIDGVSALPLISGQGAPADWQRAVLIEHHGPDFDHHDPDYQSYRSGDPPSYEALRTSDALYVEYENGQREYYDTAHDPYELHNLAATAPASVLDPLHDTLQAMAHCHGTAQCQAAAFMP